VSVNVLLIEPRLIVLPTTAVPGLVHRYPDKALFLGKHSSRLHGFLSRSWGGNSDRPRQQHQSAQFTAASAHVPMLLVEIQTQSLSLHRNRVGSDGRLYSSILNARQPSPTSWCRAGMLTIFSLRISGKSERGTYVPYACI